MTLIDDPDRDQYRDDPCEERPALHLCSEAKLGSDGGIQHDRSFYTSHRKDRIDRLVAMYFDAPRGVPRHIWPKLARLLRLQLKGPLRGLQLRWCSRALQEIHEWALSYKLYRDPTLEFEALLREAIHSSHPRTAIRAVARGLVNEDRPDLKEFRGDCNEHFVQVMRIEYGLQEGSAEELLCLDLFQMVWTALALQIGPYGTVCEDNIGPILDEVDPADMRIVGFAQPRYKK